MLFFVTYRAPGRPRFDKPYPLFRRLAFFAAAHGNIVSSRRAVDWLLADEHWWLWSVETQREAMRLLVALAPRLDVTMLAELEQAITAAIASGKPAVIDVVTSLEVSFRDVTSPLAQ